MMKAAPQHCAGRPAPSLSIVWISAAIFGLYIVALYAGAVSDGAPERWNESLPRLYEPYEMLATIGIGAHFMTGTILLLLGPIQLIRTGHESAPWLHRWLGRLYGFAALVTGLGGLAFIARKETIGGMPMSVGFSLYGALMVVAAVETVRHARARRFDEHRAWAIRLFALAIGSWLYRMDYGLWQCWPMEPATLGPSMGHSTWRWTSSSTSPT